jgi:hypothetical protein
MPMLRIQAEALTYDDVSLVPAHSTILPKDVNLETRLTRDLRLKLPIVRRHGYRHRSAPGHRHGPARRHRHHPQEHDRGAAGREVAKVKNSRPA